MSDNALEIYLTDHMAGSVSAVNLARRAAKNNDGPLGQFFVGLAREIEVNRRTLEDIAARVGTEASLLKQAGAVAAERLSRFKIDHRFTGSPELSLLLELELLWLGIHGKRALWQTLGAVADGRLADVNFGQLTQRADEQLAGLEQQRLSAARGALAS